MGAPRNGTVSAEIANASYFQWPERAPLAAEEAELKNTGSILPEFELAIEPLESTQYLVVRRFTGSCWGTATCSSFTLVIIVAGRQ